MNVRKFKQLVAVYGGNYVKDGAFHRAWWDAYDRDGHRGMHICFGRLIELIQSSDLTTLYLVGNWIHWNPPKVQAPPAKTGSAGRGFRASRFTAG
jgi:hypothetical protein